MKKSRTRRKDDLFRLEQDFASMNTKQKTSEVILKFDTQNFSNSWVCSRGYTPQMKKQQIFTKNGESCIYPRDFGGCWKCTNLHIRAGNKNSPFLKKIFSHAVLWTSISAFYMFEYKTFPTIAHEGFLIGGSYEIRNFNDSRNVG